MSLDSKITIKKYGVEHHALTVEWLNDNFLRETFGLTYTVDVVEHAKWLAENSHVEFLALYYENEYVGNIVLTHQKRHFSVWLQVYIGSNGHRGKGLGKIFMKLALEHCFETLGLHRVWLHVREQNEVAVKLYNSLGFQSEGLEREAIFDKGNFISQMRMSLLKNEYKK